ncbi:MAG: transcriptional regulator, partial [Firmicutes bacterium]|nr:transcriptional regulator [Bacillota bacterium]
MNMLFLKIINMSIAASWLVLAVLVLRQVIKKAPKWANVLLWGIVAVRLICPFSIESPVSLIPSAQTLPEKVITGPSFDV